MPCTIVLKVGTSSIINEISHDVRSSLINGVASTVADLRQAGFKVIIVSSGAVGFGLRRMNFESRPPSLSGKQVSCQTQALSLSKFKLQIPMCQ